MEKRSLGKTYRDGEVIVRQGETGECMYVIQKGKAEVLQEKEGREVRLAVLGEGDVFGEMALFEREARSATVRALGDVRALTVDKRLFLREVHEDPSLAFRILEKMSHRVRELDAEMFRLKSG
jgi:CRP/FNR family cyclic AMP-dependent transcriptional regulator